MTLKPLAIMAIVIFSLLPVYMGYQYLGRKIQPRGSMKRFVGWLFVVFVLIFVYTFLLVLLIKSLFPGA
jgi:hypothetical protein